MLARSTIAQLGVDDEAADQRQRPNEEPETPLLAHLADPEHFHKANPAQVNMKRGADGEQVLILHQVRPGTKHRDRVPPSQRPDQVLGMSVVNSVHDRIRGASTQGGRHRLYEAGPVRGEHGIVKLMK